MPRLSEIPRIVAEQVSDLSRSVWSRLSISGIRGLWGDSRFGLRFWPTSHPAMEGTIVNYDYCRALYFTSGANAYGASFAKPIVDLQVSFIGTPRASTDNEQETEFLNECLSDFWAGEIQEFLRDSMRDSKTIVRLSRPDVLDPLMTIDEAEHGALQMIPPELVEIERDPRNRRIISRAVVHHRMLFVTDDGSVEQGRDPVTEEHDVLEVISRDSYRFFDQTSNEWLENFSSSNKWNFVPLLEIYNEWDATLQGGVSEFETVIPFINAFHEALSQTLQAHKYHSTPKVVLKLNDVTPFIKNNFPEVVDAATGQIKAHGQISWQGREILFVSTEEEIKFLEAKSILGDSKTLLEFLIDCICIASQTPEWAFMRVDSGSANSDRNAQTVPFIKKVGKKRKNFQKPIQELCKMILASRDMIPTRPTITWEVIRADDEVVHMQAFQQLVMGLEVARQRGEISDETYQNMLRHYLPVMGSNTNELQPPEPAPVPQAGPRPLPIQGGPQGRNE
jgi:hypothetical protein